MSGRVLVCGGRRYGYCSPDATPAQVAKARWERDVLVRVLDASGATTIIHGEASGADSLAGAWAAEHGIPCLPFPADWKTHGKAAGPIRNQSMIDNAAPDVVIAFPGGHGTRDMKRRARKAGIPVVPVTC